MSRRWAGRYVGALMVVMVAAGLVPPAARALTASAETTPDWIAYFGADDPRTTRELVHRLHLQAGPTDERLSLDLSESYGNTDAVGQFGSSSGVRIEGPARWGQDGPGAGISGTRIDSITHTGRDRCPAPVWAGTTASRELILPAGTASTLVLTRQLKLTHVPSNMPLYAHTWRLSVVGQPDSAFSLSGPVPFYDGVEAAQLVLRAGITGSGKAIGAAQRMTARAGQELTLSGYLAPAERGERVSIWHYAPGESEPRQLATVRVDRQGRFLYRGWRPVATGQHELYAAYAGRRNVVESTRSGCGGPKVYVTASGRRL